MSALSPVQQHRQQGYEGHTLGGFRLIREIGCGGMATVYLGYKLKHAGVRQLAAVKVIHPHLARDADFVDMFLDEARIVSHIDHPNVCRVLDFGKSDGTYYLAMDYVMGETWASVAERLSADTELMTPVLAQVLAQACEGLHAAHGAQDAYGNPLRIVHRDVSPQNIMVGYDGSVRVLDFGIASASDRLHATRGGAVKGRLSYMAPEQMRGLPVDRRADVWSLGVVLWEGLARKRLFPESNDAKTVLAVTHDALPPLSGSGQPVPGILQSIVQKALLRERETRYASARELGLALSRFAMKSMTPIGMPELSECMQRLFASELDQKRVLLREAADRFGEPAPDVARERVGSESGELRVNTDTHGTDPTYTVSGVRPSALLLHPPTRKEVSTVAVWLVLALLLLLAARQSGEPTPQAQAERAPPSVAGATKSTPVINSRSLAPQPNAEKAADLTFVLSEIEDAPPDKPAARAAKPGFVSITTPGSWAEVYFGSRMLGTTPLKVTLPAGAQTLRLRARGRGQVIERQVLVSAGSTARLDVPLSFR